MRPVINILMERREMAKPIGRFTANTQWFISKYSYVATDYSKAYNVSTNAVVGAIVNEYDKRFTFDLFLRLGDEK